MSSFTEEVGNIILAVVNIAWTTRKKSFCFLSSHADDIKSTAIWACLLAVETFNPEKSRSLRDWLYYVAYTSIGKSVGQIVKRRKAVPMIQIPIVLVDDGDRVTAQEMEIVDKSTIPFYDPDLVEFATAGLAGTMKPATYKLKYARIYRDHKT